MFRLYIPMARAVLFFKYPEQLILKLVVSLTVKQEIKPSSVAFIWYENEEPYSDVLFSIAVKLGER